jgi:hypothetical protein
MTDIGDWRTYKFAAANDRNTLLNRHVAGAASLSRVSRGNPQGKGGARGLYSDGIAGAALRARSSSETPSVRQSVVFGTIPSKEVSFT